MFDHSFPASLHNKFGKSRRVIKYNRLRLANDCPGLIVLEKKPESAFYNLPYPESARAASSNV